MSHYSRLASALFLCLALWCLGSAVSAQPLDNLPRYPAPAELSLKDMAEAVKELAVAVKQPGKITFDLNLHPDGMVALIAAILAFPFALWLVPKRRTD